MNSLVNLQKKCFNEINNPLKINIDFRIQLLKKLKQIIEKYEHDIEFALKKDLGRKEIISFSAEIYPILGELNYFIKNLKKLAKDKKEKNSLLFLGCKSYTKYCPFGVVLIISPWNYPFLLSISPLIGAIAAGNNVILKPSEFSPSTSLLLKKIINEVFEEKNAQVVLGDYTKVTKLMELKMDFIFFTGSTKVGQIIMQNAAKTLTPIALELGGKSPCIIDETAPLDTAVKRIAWGKTLNSGQTCIAPDYLIIKEGLEKAFIEKFKYYINIFFNNPLESSDYSCIINEKNFNRIISYLDNQNIVFGGKYKKEILKIEPTLILNPGSNSSIMQEELFAPILPILTYKNKDDIYKIIKQNEKPLALYIFSQSKNFEKELIQNISFGGAGVNTTIFQTVNHNIPFGGIGFSGIGSYHGKYSFLLFSHKKGILKSNYIMDNKHKYPPFKNEKRLKQLLKKC